VTPGPVRVETLFTASPMFTMPHYVHPAIEETWTRIGDHLDAAAADRDYPRRIFCSRRTEKRGCRNRGEVEEIFVRNGFEVVFPEDYPVPEQIRMFRRADVVAGFAGSGMFSIAFTGGPSHVVVVGHAGYTPSNEYMMGSVLGHRLDLVVSTPDIPRPAKGMSREIYHSDFVFDVEHEGRFLLEVLAEL
jgi:capsular polysaccharide biosynthesis protein